MVSDIAPCLDKPSKHKRTPQAYPKSAEITMQQGSAPAVTGIPVQLKILGIGREVAGSVLDDPAFLDQIGHYAVHVVGLDLQLFSDL